MTFTITIKNAKEQIKLLDSISPPIICNPITASHKEYTINGVYHNGKRVEDVFRYDLKVGNNGKLQRLTPNPNRIGMAKYNDGCTSHSINPKIVLVIESPHKAEYNYNPIAPQHKGVQEIEYKAI